MTEVEILKTQTKILETENAFTKIIEAERWWSLPGVIQRHIYTSTEIWTRIWAVASRKRVLL